MKWIKWLVIAIIGAAAGICIYKATNIKQEKARKAGRHVPYGPYEAFFKRPLDLIISVAALIILSPVLLIIAILVRVKLGSPVVFKQERPGKIDSRSGKEKIFTLYKFRSMTDRRGEDDALFPDAERMTPFGSALRASSGDELLELINIAKADMSIVGPRPLLVEYLPRYSEEQRHRHDVRPGLTSLSASQKRNLASWEEKFADDVKYVNKITFLGDVNILIDTVKIVLNRKGISSETSATMEAFTGNKE